MNHLHHRKVIENFSVVSLTVSDRLISPVSSDYPVANLLVKELEEKISESISNLPQQCRNVFIMIRYEDLTYKEAANKLGVSVNTIKTQLRRALIHLREDLRNYLPAASLMFSVSVLCLF